MKPGRAYLLEEFVSDENGGPFLHEFLRPAGIHHYMLCYSEEPSGYRAWLSLGRGPGAEPFSAACREKLEAVSRHFRTALEVFAVLNRTQFDLEVHSRATAALSFGTITLDQSGRFLTADAGARLQLTGQTMLQVRSERLRLSHRELDAQLQKTIQALLRQPGGSRFMSLNLGEDAGLELLLCAPERRSAWLSAATPTLMVYLRSTGDSPQPEIGPIAELFQLGNREAQLASLLACGKTLSEAAEELHITESTARTYSKRIFEKTGVRRQTDLVRRILTSVAPLAMARSR
jgi:DNA-binding CsgD family transcriptional regulator